MEDESNSAGGSPLSMLSSDAFERDEEQERLDAEVAMPPTKRQKLSESSAETAEPYLHAPIPGDDTISISSDSSGEIPNSPTSRLEEDDVHEQVTECIWTGCPAGDLGDMDKLVDHIHNEHMDLETRGKKYACEWDDCARKGLPHASAYALKAHMRSHTREKPFYCTLPECDRAFTRSDALAKHHRTVHETEALRPSDPIPKSMQAANKSRQKVSSNPAHPQIAGQLPGHQNAMVNGHPPPGWTSSYPSELGFTPDEEAIGPKELYRLLRRQIHWAEEEAEALKKQAEMMEELRRKEWVDKETLFDRVFKTEIDWHERRRLVLAGSVDIQTSAARAGEWNAANSPTAPAPSSPSPMVKGQPVEDQREAAAVLASLHQA